MSTQSAAVMQSTQRWVAVLQTCPVGQASELMQVTYGTHLRATQSLLGGQSVVAAQSTHWEIDVSQTLPAAHSRLFRHDVTTGGPLPPPPPSFLEPEALFELHPPSAATRSARPKADDERSQTLS
jgi:hypothetical protein